MFDDTIVQVLGNSPKGTNLKNIFADVQEYNQEIQIDDYNLNIYKRLYIDYIEPMIQLNTYLKIENEITQVIKVNRYPSYLEVYVCKVIDIKINNIEKSVIIIDIKDKTIDYNTILTENKLETGDLIFYQKQNWLVIGEVSQNNEIFKATIRKCREFKYKNQIIYGLVDSVTFNVVEGRFFNFIDNEILITLSNNNKVRLGDIIEFNRKSYSVQAINDTVENTIILRCKYDITNTHTYKIELNVTNIDIREEETYPIKATPYIDSKIDETAIINYASSDTKICTVDSNGLVIGIKAGTTTIKVTYQNEEEIIKINILSKPQISYAIHGSDTIDIKTIQTYTVVDKDNIPVTDKEFKWKFEQIGEISFTSLVLAKGFTSNTYSVIAKSQYTKGSFMIVAICKTDESIITKKEIKVV